MQHQSPTTPANNSVSSPWRFCVAPMLDWTDRHCRFFLRQISRHARLYTDMVTTGAILHGDRTSYLRFDVAVHSVALPLGGPDAAALEQSSEERRGGTEGVSKERSRRGPNIK